MKFKVDDDFDRATAIQMLATARSACERMMRHAPGQGPCEGQEVPAKAAGLG
jgi:hypothetical protein